MTARKVLVEIINGHQADMLELMREALGPLSMRDLQTGITLGRTMVMRHLVDLRERGLVDMMQHVSEVPAPHQGRHALLYAISRSGSRALARYKRRLEESERVIVPPPTFNTRALPPYEPPKQSYYRNAGNRHIASRGFSC